MSTQCQPRRITGTALFPGSPLLASNHTAATDSTEFSDPAMLAKANCMSVITDTISLKENVFLGPHIVSDVEEYPAG